MKRIFSILAIGCLVCSVHSQAPAQQALTPAEIRKLLEANKEANAKLLEQQAKTLQMLEEMDKTAQTLKTLGKRG